MVPGIPLRKVNPSIPLSAANRAALTSGTAVPASIWLFSSNSSPPNPRPSRITTPGTPPSRTSVLDPTPSTVTGTSAGVAARNAARSSSSAGVNNTSAGPPVRNQVKSASGNSGSNRPRTAGNRASNALPSINSHPPAWQALRAAHRPIA